MAHESNGICRARNCTLKKLGTLKGTPLGTLLYQSTSQDSFRIPTVGWENVFVFSHYHVLLTNAYNFSRRLGTYAMFWRFFSATFKIDNWHYLINKSRTCSKACHASPVPGDEISRCLAALERTINMSFHQYFQAYSHLLPCNLTSPWLKMDDPALTCG